ncbi:MAG: ATP synthase F1 subunit gamma [Blautia sp.]|nr:ATP synthase F1 subunit gamma [Blautia sp.]
MAANMKAVKLRIKSVQNTMQITRAMELVASSKLRKAKERADNCRPYFEELYRTLDTIASGNTDFSSVYAREAASERWCYVVVAGDRGLAGGYNANLFKRLEAEAQGKDYTVLPLGKKSVEYFKRRGVPILTESFAEVAKVKVGDCFEMARMLCKEFREGNFGHISLCYTQFHNMLSQAPDFIPALPLMDLTWDDPKDRGPVRDLILYEPDSAEVFDAIVPEYLAGLIYGAVCESEVSELAARRTAMEAATNNAEEMIEKLNLHYNRARQASITQEITEIVAGAEGV